MNAEKWFHEERPKLKKCYNKTDIFNSDETGVYYIMLLSKNLKLKGKSCKGEEMAKERITFWKCSPMRGDKPPLLAIGKTKNPKRFKDADIRKFDYYNNKNSRMTSSIWKNVCLNGIIN